MKHSFHKKPSEWNFYIVNKYRTIVFYSKYNLKYKKFENEKFILSL